MEFKILKNEFLQALTQIQGVVEKKNVMPVLANVLLETSENVLKISATDLEVALHVQVQAEVKTPGQITVLAKKLFDIVKEAAGEEIQVKVSENERLELTSLKNQCRIMALPANEFPKLPETEGEFVSVKTEEFTEMLSKVSFAMSTDETRYHLNGVYFEESNGQIVCVATDGHRLSMNKKALNWEGLKDRGIIIPRKGVNELKKLISQQKAFEFSVGKRHVYARTEKQMLFIRLIDGDFPNYNRVLPEQSQINVEIPREEFIGALRRVSLLSDEYSKGVKLYFCQNALLVNTTNLEVGEAKEEIPIQFNEEALEVSFNAKYLLDVLNVLTEEKVILGFNDKSSPCIVKTPGDEGFVSVIMPMRA